MRKPFLALFAAVAAIALFAAGCGGSDDTTGSTTGSADGADTGLTKTEFLKQGNAICADANKELNEDFEEFTEERNVSENNPLTTAQLREVAEDIVAPIVGRQIKEIRGLGAPSGDEQRVEAILAAAEEGIKKGEEDPQSLTAENGNAFAKANRLSRQYGLQTCSE